MSKFYCPASIITGITVFKVSSTLNVTSVAEPPLFGRLGLQVAKVRKPTPAPALTYFGRLQLRLHAKKDGSGSCLNDAAGAALKNAASAPGSNPKKSAPAQEPP